MHTGLNPQREPTSRLASPQSIGPWNVLSAVRGIEGSDMGSDPFERTPLIHVWLWVSDLVLGPSSQRKGDHLNHHGRLACTQLLAINSHCRVFVLELVVSALKDVGLDVRRVSTSEPVEVSLDGVFVVSFLHERCVQPCCSLDECFWTRARCVEAVELTCNDTVFASR